MVLAPSYTTRWDLSHLYQDLMLGKSRVIRVQSVFLNRQVLFVNIIIFKKVLSYLLVELYFHFYKQWLVVVIFSSKRVHGWTEMPLNIPNRYR